ncbi:MAG: dienelactone hydrolase family protein [Candidatus Dormibacteria bacterium]
MEEMSDARSGGSDSDYWAVPPGSGPWPGVVVIMDALGISADLRQQCDRLARAGYLALAPDLYSWGSKITCIRAAFVALRRGSGRAFQDIEAARIALARHSDCNGAGGVIGFCMGGGFALLSAAGGRYRAASVNYGQVPQNPANRLEGVCPVVASYGARDRQLRGHAARLSNALAELGVEHDVWEYPGVGHGFMNHHVGKMGTVIGLFGVRYDAESAEDSWRRILAFFAEHLNTAPPASPPVA